MPARRLAAPQSRVQTSTQNVGAHSQPRLCAVARLLGRGLCRVRLTRRLLWQRQPCSIFRYAGRRAPVLPVTLLLLAKAPLGGSPGRLADLAFRGSQRDYTGAALLAGTVSDYGSLTAAAWFLKVPSLLSTHAPRESPSDPPTVATGARHRAYRPAQPMTARDPRPGAAHPATWPFHIIMAIFEKGASTPLQFRASTPRSNTADSNAHEATPRLGSVGTRLVYIQYLISRLPTSGFRPVRMRRANPIQEIPARGAC